MPGKESTAFAKVITVLEKQEDTYGEGQTFLICFYIRTKY